MMAISKNVIFLFAFDRMMAISKNAIFLFAFDRMMAISKNAIFLFAFCSLCSGMPADEGRQEVSRFMLVFNK